MENQIPHTKLWTFRYLRNWFVDICYPFSFLLIFRYLYFQIFVFTWFSDNLCLHYICIEIEHICVWTGSWLYLHFHCWTRFWLSLHFHVRQGLYCIFIFILKKILYCFYIFMMNTFFIIFTFHCWSWFWFYLYYPIGPAFDLVNTFLRSPLFIFLCLPYSFDCIYIFRLDKIWQHLQ